MEGEDMEQENLIEQINEQDNKFIFYDLDDNQVQFYFTSNKLEISIPYKAEHYFIFYDSIISFQVSSGYYGESLLFVGKIEYHFSYKIKVKSNYYIFLKKSQDINYRDVIESHSPLRTPMSETKEKYELWKRKVSMEGKETGNIRFLGISKLVEWDIYVDDFVYVNTKSAQRIPDEKGIYFELPLGTYNIKFTAGGNFGNGNNDGYSGVCSNEVKITLSTDRPIVSMVGKIGLIRAKLSLISNKI